jgi:hypothetical protein
VVDLEKPSEAEGVPPRTRRRLWILSALVSLACLVVLIGTWVRVYTAPPAPEPADTVVTTPDEATRYLETLVPAPEPGSEPPVVIPTGLYIESMQFRGPYNVQVSGYVWQRYADDLPQDITKGVVMPGAERARITEVYRAQQGDEELVGWSFEATLREEFNYDRYPLDRQQIWILLWHTDFERNVYLEPDLGAYASLDPAALSGVDTDFVLENWDVEESFFSYRANRYNADFGVQGFVADEKRPELYFNVSIQRHL